MVSDQVISVALPISPVTAPARRFEMDRNHWHGRVDFFTKAACPWAKAGIKWTPSTGRPSELHYALPIGLYHWRGCPLSIVLDAHSLYYLAARGS